MINLSEFVRWHARRTPDRLAIAYDSERVTWADLHDRILRMAAYMRARGVGENDVVAALMRNSTAFLEIAFAASHLGAVFLPINFRLARDELEYVLGDAKAVLFFADSEFEDSVGADANIETVYVDESAQRDSRRITRSDLPLPGAVPVNTQNVMRLMYTSGTTERPKGVVITYENFYWKSMAHVIALGLTAEDRLLVVGPLCHVGAFDLPGMAVLWVGGMACVHRSFDLDKVLGSIEREELTGAWLAPVMLGRILGFENRHHYDVSSLKWCVGGGEKTPESRIRAFTTYFNNGRYIDSYGLTESVSGDTFMDPGMELAKIGSTGRPVAHQEIEIMDDEGALLPCGEVGDICLRGPKVTPGYWNSPEKTAASFFGDWFRTGDAGYLDCDGFLYLTDRKKDMIITGGENVASSEVERVIESLPEVAEVGVIGVPDEKWGERIVAVVVVKEGKTLDYAAIEEHCRKHLAGFKVPREVVFRETLPRNPSGKIIKRTLREEYGQ